jgi:hypothetical protein
MAGDQVQTGLLVKFKIKKYDVGADPAVDEPIEIIEKQEFIEGFGGETNASQ